MCADRDGARRLLVDGQPVTPTDIQVRSVVACDGDTVYFHANSIDDVTVQHACRWSQEDGALVRARRTHLASTRSSLAEARPSSGQPRWTTHARARPYPRWFLLIETAPRRDRHS